MEMNMLNQLKNLTARIGGCSELVDFCLHARKRLLITYYRLTGINADRGWTAKVDDKVLDDFCQNLVDYLSTGHFTAYERFIRELENRDQLAKAKAIYPSLSANTEQIMEIYDTHLENAIGGSNTQELQYALSMVGEALAERFALEDKFIALVLDKDNENPPV